MKKLLFAGIIFLPFITHAQTTFKPVERYCDLQVSAKMFTRKLAVHIDYGTDSLAVKLKPGNEDEKLKNLTNFTDVLNYMSEQGWVLVSSTTTTNSGMTDGVHFFFKKELQAREQ
ncbi:MAG TPA: hypothetical protein VHB48_11690 [Chitinophagaceae bacterium]|nr:hypothetical protein [Chitinophagaceae bacterium]